MNNEEWGNISLPGLSDEELFNTNWARRALAQELKNDPNWRKQQKDAVQSQEHRQLKSQQTAQLWSQPEFAESQRKILASDKVKAKQRERALAREQDPKFQEKKKQALEPTYKDPVRNNKISERRKQFIEQHPEYREQLSKQAKQQHADRTEEETKAIMDKRSANPRWRKAVEENGKRKRKPIMTPAGRFDSKGLAAKHYGVDPAAIGYWMSKKPTEYYYIDPLTE